MGTAKPGHQPAAQRHAPVAGAPRPPAGHRVTACKSCRAAVIWVQMPSGSKMPLDAIPSPKGDIVLAPVQPPVAWHKRESDTPEQLAGASIHTSHFATCPDANRWRRPKGDRTDA